METHVHVELDMSVTQTHTGRHADLFSDLKTAAEHVLLNKHQEPFVVVCILAVNTDIHLSKP